LDTNILVYAADTTSPFHTAARTLRDKGLKGRFLLCVAPQVLLEFFAVITSAKRVTTPLSPSEAITEIKKYLKASKILKIYPKEDVLERTLELVKTYEVKRQEIFDLQLVATMLSNGVKRMYTYNTDHFSKFTEIEVLTP
jgi:predicted nucleic acid-binding protein